ncbi:Acetyl-CoA:oxalate CoA-transferase [subsurface metagenome]
MVTENYRPNTMQKLGLGYKVLKEINLGIIYASVCGFGHKSLYQERPGYDIIAQATGGIMVITGQIDGPPTRVGSSIGDIFSGSFATIGILAALRVRDKIGLGQEVDISMMDAVLSVLENAVVRYTVTGEIPKRIGSGHPSIAPFDVFEAQDG